MRRSLLAALAVLTAAALLAPASAPAAGQRIVALTPFSANTLAQLGVRPVGVGQTLGGRNRLAPKLRGVEVLPLSHPNGPNLEQLASLDPDLVFSSPTWAKGNNSMGDLGIRVAVREPARVGGVLRETRAIGRMVKRPRRARQLVRITARRVARARRGIQRRPTVMLILGVGRTPFTFLRNSWGGDLVTKAGGRLLTGGASAAGGFARISDEVVIAEDPDVIVAVPHANEEDIPSLTQYLRDNPAWQSTSAVQNDRIYISVDNSLLQPGTDVARTIWKVRKRYLKN